MFSLLLLLSCLLLLSLTSVSSYTVVSSRRSMLKGALKDATCGISALTVGLVPTMLPTIAKAENGYTAAQVAEPTEVSVRYELKSRNEGIVSFNLLFLNIF